MEEIADIVREIGRQQGKNALLMTCVSFIKKLRSILLATPGPLTKGELDQTCPNVLDHGKTRHVINARAFVKRLQRQLSETVNADCEVLGIHGSRGALLKVTLSSHGYTVPAKCTVPEFAEHFRHEAAVYARLRPIQGIYIPLYLGSIDLAHPYSYDGIATQGNESRFLNSQDERVALTDAPP
ncbi:hypothetical protein PENNAL_c0111G10958 [Penicillium nalgiovense]|uniref:Uncharacterized protein n=1 Tax=Penicillium nalgiovense TaxID=60175 RepID=A0A1V6X7K9_PENNA|nr:hypothetical protein PENNAL_c0111G10958 [Penicillium nalgiovense]